jgi:hypothetical protein
MDEGVVAFNFYFALKMVIKTLKDEDMGVSSIFIKG